MRVVVENIMMHCSCTEESAEKIADRIVYDYSNFPEGWAEAVDDAREGIAVFHGGVKNAL
tara:strand:- start:1589 stop:1768 length:180 start_codon:yes stop_codon:yes gene_type:complete